MKLKRRLALIPACALLLCSCGDKQANTKSTADLSSYPIKTETELTYWVASNSNIAATATNLGDTPFAKELEKQTGVKVKYIHPALGQESEAFSLMIASNELADMIEYSWNAALGGPTTSIEDGIIVSLNDYMDEYAPALSSYLKDNPDINRSIITDDGQYYCFPFLRGAEKLCLSAGPLIRQDWLEELGIDIPKTVEDWENMLIRFRDEKGATAPITFRSDQVGQMFSLMSSINYFYNDNGTIKYGPLEPEWYNACETLNRWFETGLLDNNYTMVDSSIWDANMLNGKSGAAIGGGGGDLGRWLQTMKAKNSSFKLVGVPFPGIGDSPAKMVNVSPQWPGHGTAISTACKDIPLAVKYLDYSYTEAGHILNNFGIEGESFTYVDDEPIYTDYVMDNDEGLSVSQAMGRYCRANYLGPFVQDIRYLEQYYGTDVQRNALDAWFDAPEEAKNKYLPTFTLTSDETTEFSSIVNEATKYVDESRAAFISGAKPLGEYDKFVKDLKGLKIDRVIEIYQAALDRYNNRK